MRKRTGSVNQPGELVGLKDFAASQSADDDVARRTVPKAHTIYQQ